MVAPKRKGKVSKRGSAKAAYSDMSTGDSSSPRYSDKADFGIRGLSWPLPWFALAEAYGNATGLATAMGVSYQTLYRWATKGDVVPESSAKLVRILAAQKNLPSPV